MAKFTINSSPDSIDDFDKWQIAARYIALKNRRSYKQAMSDRGHKELTATIYSPKLVAPLEKYQDLFFGLAYYSRLANHGAITASSVFWKKSKRKCVEIVVEPVDS